MVAVFLVHFTVGGAEVLTEMALEDSSSTYFLPNDPREDGIKLTSVLDEQHSHLCLEVHSDFTLLRSFDESKGPCSVLSDDGTNVKLPLSTPSHLKSIILRAEDQFIGPTGRWAVRWEGEHGTSSNSMRPPPMPVVYGTEILEEVLREISNEEVPTCDQVSSRASTESTYSPTPPGKDNRSTEGTGSIVDKVTSNADPRSPERQSMCRDCSRPQDMCEHGEADASSEVGGSVGPPATPGTLLSNESRTEELHSAAKSNNEHEIRLETPLPNPDLKDSMPKSPAALTPLDEVSTKGSTDPNTSNQRARKRKLVEIEASEPNISNIHAEMVVPGNGESPSTIVVRRTSKVPAAHRREENIGTLKTPAGLDSTLLPSTPINETPDSTPSSVQLSSKKRSRRRASHPSPSRYNGPAPVTIFSGHISISKKRTAMKTFERLGGRVTDSINEANLLCIAEGPLKKTGKFIMAVAKGMDMVTEKWVADAHRLGRLPAINGYIPLDGSRERQWKFNLKEAIGRGKQGLTHLLSGTTVILTKQLRIDLGNLAREISEIATILGADAVKSRVPALKDRSKYTEKKLLIIGVRGDPLGAHVGRLGHKLYNRDILTMAALRGEVEWNCEDFVIDVPIKDEGED